MQRRYRQQSQSQSQQPPPMHWGLDSLTDAILVLDPEKNRNQTGVHVVTPGNLSHQSSTNSAASYRSNHSRSSTYTVPESAAGSVTPTSLVSPTLPVTFYQVPHTYDEPPTTSASMPPRTTNNHVRQTPSSTARVDNNHPISSNAEFVVATFGMTHARSHILFDQPYMDDRYELAWKVDRISTPLTMLHFSGPASRFRDRLRGLGSGRGITTFLVCVSMDDFNTVYVFLDAIRDCMDHDDKSWWYQVVLVFDQIEIQQHLSQIERDNVLREIPRIQAHYGMPSEPNFCFITTTPDIVRHPVQGADYRHDCQRVLHDIMSKNRKYFGCWRPHLSEDEEDDDDDEFDGFRPKVIHVSGRQ